MAPTAGDRRQSIDSCARGYDDVLAALEGITVEQLDTREALPEWSPREIIHHLGDSEMDGAERIRMIVAERQPRLTSWDQERWVAPLYSDERPIEASLAGFNGAREATVPLLHLLTERQWRRAGQHSEFGPMSGDDWLSFYSLHAQDQTAEIMRARAAV